MLALSGLFAPLDALPPDIATGRARSAADIRGVAAQRHLARRRLVRSSRRRCRIDAHVRGLHCGDRPGCFVGSRMSRLRSSELRRGRRHEGATVMAHATHRSMRRGGLIGLAALLLLQPARAQQGEHWVGTWMVAHIGRPQNPPAPVAPPAPAPGRRRRRPRRHRRSCISTTRRFVRSCARASAGRARGSCSATPLAPDR